jgi:hypothetical protein
VKNWKFESWAEDFIAGKILDFETCPDQLEEQTA